MEARRDETTGIASSRALGVRVLVVILVSMLCVAMLRQGRFAGLLRPYRVHGASMAPGLQGESLVNPCLDCGFPIRVAVDLLAAPEFLTCPNCGYRDTPCDTSQRRPGERVVIDRWGKYLDGLARWEVVAFRQDISASVNHPLQRLAVKRIVGLPGETIAFHHGDLYANGVLVRKSMKQIREMAVLLYDTYYRPKKTPALPDRFHPLQPGNGWKRLATGYQYAGFTESAPGRSLDEKLDRLRYDHWACMPYEVPPRDRTALSAVKDHYAYNHSQSRGLLHEVQDLLVQCSVSIQGDGYLAITLFSRQGPFQVGLDMGRLRYEIRHHDEVISSARFPVRWSQQSSDLEIAVVDQQVILAVDGITWCRLQVPVNPEMDFAVSDMVVGSERPCLLAACDLEIHVHRLRLYRDLYWTGPGDTAEKWDFARRLGSEEYFLVGDNVPVSEDCRHWQTGVSRGEITGKIYRFK